MLAAHLHNVLVKRVPFLYKIGRTDSMDCVGSEPGSAFGIGTELSLLIAKTDSRDLNGQKQTVQLVSSIYRERNSKSVYL